MSEAQEHYEKAERLLGDADRSNHSTEVWGWIQRQAQVHATLALAGFVRDAATAHVHDVVTAPMLGGTPTQATTTTGRPT